MASLIDWMFAHPYLTFFGVCFCAGAISSAFSAMFCKCSCKEKKE